MKTYPQLTNIFRLKPFTGAGFGVFWQALRNKLISITMSPFQDLRFH